MLVQLENLEKAYGDGADRQRVLRGVSLDLDRGESLAITGESGSGKSTLLHLIGLLDAPDAGQIVLDGDIVSTLNDTGRAQRRRGGARCAVLLIRHRPLMSPMCDSSEHTALKSLLLE